MSSSAGQSSSPEVPSAAGELAADSPSTSSSPSTTPPPPPPLAAELGQPQEVEWAKESKVTTTTPITTTTTTSSRPTSATDSGRLCAGGATPHQLKCSVTLDKLPKRVRLALTKNSKKKKALLTTNNAAYPADDGELLDEAVEATAVDDPSAAVLCQFCDRSLPQQHYGLHQEQEHLTANLGRRASGRASSINSFPGCSLCNVVVLENKHFTCHSNDLDALFAHLTEKHADRYFACRSCNERYADAETFARHTKRVHGQRRRDRKKSSSSSSVGELNKIDAGDGEKVLQRKVTRQSNHYNNRDSGSGSSKGGGGGGGEEQQSPSLSRMAQAQNRFPLRGPARAIKGRLAANNQKANETRNGRGAKLSRSTSVSSTSSNQTNHTSSTGTPPPSGGLSSTSSKSTSNLPSNNVFDENFYETITVTVRRNLSKWVDGKIEDKGESCSGSAAKDVGAEEVEKEQEDEGPSAALLLDHVPPTVRSTLFRTPPVGVQDESEIHEATALSAVTAFPTLLTAEQYGLEGQAGGKIKRMFTKNSWKWKFDFVKKYKYVNEGGKIVKKAKEPNLGQRDLSKLDMWTQLTMRTKHEETKRSPAAEESESELDTSAGSSATIGESVREEKRRQVNQLDTILDSRLLPEIGMEQNEQRLIKLEEEAVVDAGPSAEEASTVDQRPKREAKEEQEVRSDDFPLGLQLKRNPNPIHHKTGLTLSGEWARPRCYVCIGCGSKFETVKLLQDHKLTEHPNTQTTHYEMVGRELIEGDLFQHLYIPRRAIRTGNEHQKTTEGAAAEKPQPRGRRAATNAAAIVRIADDATVPCSKCKKDCAGRFELYRHMLDCVGDYAWLMAKKRFKYRYYGNRSRRRKSNARSVFGCVRPQKKTVKKERLDRIKRRKMRSRRTKAQKPSDAETIEKMLANLPEKRVSRTVTTPPSSAAKVAAGPAGVSTTTPSASSSSSSVVTPSKTTATPAVISSSTGKKMQQQQQHSTSKASTTAASLHCSLSGSATGTKRNLRSTLEAAAEAKAAAATVATGAAVKANKRSKSASADNKREVKVAAREAAPGKSEPEDRKEDEIVSGKEAVEEKDEAVDNNDESTNGKVEQGEKQEESVDPVGKRKTFMTRLASNTKGIIKKIGRKMKGKNSKTKKQQEKKAGHSEVDAGEKEKASSPQAVDGDSFLGEASRGLYLAAEEDGKGGVQVTAKAVTTTKLAAVPPPTNREEGEKSASEESASVAADSSLLQEPDDQSERPNPTAIVVPVSIVVDVAPLSSGEQETGQNAEGKSTELPSNNNKGTLSVPDHSSPQVSPSLSVPSNASNLSSPMTSPTLQKRRIRKLNDCIARLTDKLQEKLTKPASEAAKTIQPESSPLPSPEPCLSAAPPVRNIIRVPQLPPPSAAPPVRTAVPPSRVLLPSCVEVSVPLDVPLNLSLKRDSADSLSSSSLLRLAPVPVPSLMASAPQLVDECRVVDLSVREMLRNVQPSSSASQQSPPTLEMPRINSVPPLAISPEKSSIESTPKSRMRLPEELLKVPLNLAHVEQPQIHYNSNGELIVPHVPKAGNYEVIKIPTYLPQKPAKGSRRGSKAAAAAGTPGSNAGAATVTSVAAAAAAAAAAMKKSNATSAIEKITELVADIVRNKKREAARKELAEAAAVQIPPLLPSIPAPVIASAVMAIPPPLLIPPPTAMAVEVPQKKSLGRKRGGKSRAIGSIFEGPAAVLGTCEQVQGKTVDELSQRPQSSDKPVLPIVPPEVKAKVPVIVQESVIEEVPQPPVVLRSKVDFVDSVDPVEVSQGKEEQNENVIKRDVPPSPTVAADEVKLTEKKPTKSRGTAKGKKKVVIVEPEEPAPLIDESMKEGVELRVPTTPTRSKRNAREGKKPKGVLKKPSTEEPHKVIDDVQDISPPVKGQNGKVQRTVVVNKSGKENKKVKIVEPETQETEEETVVKPAEELLIHVAVTSSKDDTDSIEGQESKKPATPKVRKKRQSELAQILATQPVINNTERDMSLTRRKSICIPELSAKRVDSPKLKPSPPKRKKDNVEAVVAVAGESPQTVKVTEQLAAAEGDDRLKESHAVDVEEQITANIVEAVTAVEVEVSVDKKEKKTGKGQGPRVNKKKGKREVAEEQMKVEEEIPPVELEKPVPVEEVPDELPKNPTPKPKKKRRSELTQIIADQLLESFKEVDEAQKDNLKILHDLSWADETMEIASRLKQSPIPRRQVTKKKPHLAAEESRRSPVVVAKKTTPTEASALKAAPEVEKERGDENKTTAELETAADTTQPCEEAAPVRPKELSVVSTNIEAEKSEALPIVIANEKDVLSSPSNSSSTTTTTSLFNTPVTATPLAITPKPVLVSKQQQQTPTTPSEEMSLFWKQNVDKEANVTAERRLEWGAKASKTVGDLSDDSSTNKPSNTKPGASSSTTTFVLKPSRLQAIASPPLVDSFDLLRNCDRSSASSSFCSPVVSPVGEPKKCLLSVAALPTFNVPARSAAHASNGGTPLSPNAPLNLLQFRDVPREVDESDGDLEDNVSVHSSDSMESSMTTMTKSKVPRKRRKRSLLTKKKVRAASQLALKANKENGQAATAATAAEKFHCEICNKTFEKADRLAKHKITLTHISRLSEIEFLNSQNAKAAALDEEVVRQQERRSSVAAVPEVKVSLLPVESIPALPPRSPEPQNVAVGTGAAVTPTPLLVSNLHRSPLSPGLQAQQHSSQSTLHNVHLEPISSPEQPQPSYLMSGGGGMSLAGVGGSRPEAPFGAAMSNLAKRPSINVAGLSQEEKLFYECCNMLKGSDRVGTQSENNSLTPRSNEAVSTWYSKTSTAFAVRSPTSHNYHRQRSPKYAFSKLDLNQFSDISSDSDNTYPSRGRALVNGAQQVMAPSFQNVMPGSREVLAMDHQMVADAAGSNCSAVGNLSAGGAVVSPLRRDDAAVAVYSDSDMGDSFPSAPEASDNESYVRTILDRASNNNRVEWVAGGGHEGAGYRREEATTTTATNDQSAAGKVKTKAAMKGFDNFRVSIPTDGLDMDQALNGGAGTGGMHPHLDSKLASLADIALRSSTLPLIETAINVLNKEEMVLDEDVEPEPEEEDHQPKEDTPAVKTPTKKATKNGRKAPQTRTDKNSVGNRLGFKAKKRKGSEGNQAAAEGRGGANKSSSGEGGSKNGLDVYDFDDSQGSTEVLILPMKKSGKAAVESTAAEQAESSGTTPEVAPVSRTKGKGRAVNKKTKAAAAEATEDVPNEAPVVVDAPEGLDQSSQLSSDSFSDRDDFNYNSPAVEDSDLSSRGTPVRIPSTAPAKSLAAGSKKAAKKPLDNVQKKCLIMGRIFKNAQKNSKAEATKASSPPLSSSTVVGEEGGPKKAAPKVELDKLFDILKGDEPKAPIKSDKKGKTEKSEAASKKASSPAAALKNGSKSSEVQKSILKKTEKRGKASSVIDEEEQQTKKLIAELINDDLAVGQRKSKRKCIQQVNFVETWSSDEYEEFHSTKDIIAMIEANEKKSGGGGAVGVVSLGRKKKVPSATVEEPIKMAAEKKAGKIQSRRKTIGFKETDEDLGRGRKEVRFSPIRDFVAPQAKEVLLPQKKHKKDVPSGGKERGTGGGDGAKQVGRQKRVSSEKLYYWSSSSSADDEDGEGGNAVKGSNGKAKLGGGGEAADDDEDNEDSAMEQHGWIVGGSHKKLVTMLAHAKGKKSDVTPKK